MTDSHYKISDKLKNIDPKTGKIRKQRKSLDRKKEEVKGDNPKYKGANRTNPNSILGSRGFGINSYYNDRAMSAIEEVSEEEGQDGETKRSP